MTEVRLNALRKQFGSGADAVAALDLVIASGEFLTLLGPSGCGKSTTLRMIAGLEAPTSGEIHFGARRVDRLAPAQRNIAMVFQNYALYPHLNVRGNLEYPLRKQNVPTPDRAGRVAAVARSLQIEALLDRKPRQLSGGQQQRVALGRAMIRDPSVFLFDEPLSNLDAQLRTSMRAELIRLHRQIGRTMIYVTHDQLEAMTMSDRIAVMQAGKLQQIGPPAEIYGRPANMFVAGFVGTPAMNFAAGAIVAGAPPVFRSQAIDVALAGPVAARGGVTAGIRPEHILLGRGAGRAEISVVEPTGHECLVILKTADGEMIARAPADTRLQPSEAVAFEIAAPHLHLFDTQTGLRLPAEG